MARSPIANASRAALWLLTHARLQDDGFSLRTVRFDTKPRATARIIVGLGVALALGLRGAGQVRHPDRRAGRSCCCSASEGGRRLDAAPGRIDNYVSGKVGDAVPEAALQPAALPSA